MPTPTSRRSVRRLLALPAALTVVAAAALVANPIAAAAPTTPARARSVQVKVIAFNDFHGNLQPPSGSSGRVVLADGTTVDAGGAAYLATHVKRLKEQARAAGAQSIVVSSGDSIGASPLASALFHDEPTIAVLNTLGLTASAVGNHEFDEGFAELKRIQRGGCHPVDGCQFEDSYAGANFPILGANVYRTNGRPAMLPFTVAIKDGVPIGVIGVTLRDLPSVVVPSAVAGLRFGDEVQAIDRTSRLLDRLGVKAQVVLMHQGDSTEGPANGPNDCKLTTDTAKTIAERATARVDAFFTAHSHQQYNCTVVDPAGQPRPLIQGLSFGRLLSTVDLTVDRRSREVVRSATTAENVIVTRTVTPDPRVQGIVGAAVTKSAPIANRQVGTITADLTRAGDPATGESTLGDVIADAQLAATRANGAVVAITNPGGIRADLTYASSPAGEGAGVVTYGEAYTVQPFGNIMQTITLTGTQLDAVLEQQWQPTATRILQISATLRYTQTVGNAVGDRVSNITVAGVPVDPAASYRVSVNNFLAAGGDGFTVFAQGTNLTGGPIDLDALTAYLTANPNLAPPPLDRITRG